MMLKQVGNYLLRLTYLNYQSVCYRSNLKRPTPNSAQVLNPGIRRQLNALKEGPEVVDDDLEAFEDDEFEADFMNLDLTHKEHVEQIYKLKEQEKFSIIKQKYFKKKLPNFLTWYDKQQIQYLHNTNQEWTIEALSEGFPALPETIKKIVKMSWTKKNHTKIINHDTSVKKNWTMFKSGQLDLPPDLTKHLSKFTNRETMYYNSENIQNIKDTPKKIAEISGEFSEIIQSYERLKHMKEETLVDAQEKPKQIESNQIESYPIKNKRNQPNVTLDHLKSSLKKDIELGKNITEDDKILLQESTKQEPKDVLSGSSVIDLKEISKTAYLTVNTTTSKDNKHLRYPEKITIPKENLKRGYTYKLNDCYYDSDGWFLYRVPGMD